MWKIYSIALILFGTNSAQAKNLVVEECGKVEFKNILEMRQIANGQISLYHVSENDPRLSTQGLAVVIQNAFGEVMHEACAYIPKFASVDLSDVLTSTFDPSTGRYRVEVQVQPIDENRKVALEILIHGQATHPIPVEASIR